MYDPAGEAIEREEDIEGHRFLRYFDGLALLIDPFSLPTFARQYREAGHASLPLSTAHGRPIEIVHRIVNVLESQADLSRTRRYQRRIAVIFTKADSEFFQRTIGLTLDTVAPSPRWKDAGNDLDQRLRSWLQQNEPDLLHALEVRFAKLRFFVASALGHDPATGKAFEPKRTLHPLCWLLSGRTTLSKPLLALSASRAAEGAAMFAALLIFILPAFLGSYYGWSTLQLLRLAVQSTKPEAGVTGGLPSESALLQKRPPNPTQEQETERKRQQVELADREQRAYYSAQGSLDALRRYVNSCTVCTFDSAARSEISRLETVPSSKSGLAPRAPDTITSSLDANFVRYIHSDLPGNDMKSLKKTTLQDCESECRSSSECQAYSFDKWNQFCLLKNGVSTLTLSPKAISGVRGSLPEPPTSVGSIRMDHYRGKGFPDKPASTLYMSSLLSCEEACAEEASCVAYTFLRGTRNCKLFDDTGEYFPDTAADSGVKAQSP
jgi:hypothetical protein